MPVSLEKTAHPGNPRAVWTGQRRWPAQTWSNVLALSGFFVLRVGCAFKFIRLGANY